MTKNCFHPLALGADDALPEAFNCPFSYTPHPLCVRAAAEVSAHLARQAEWASELAGGKMFGVLLVADADGNVGFLAAFSGLLCGRNTLPFFVPPVVDLLAPDGHFKTEEKAISALNGKIRELQNSELLKRLERQLSEAEKMAEKSLFLMKEKMLSDKKEREKRRKSADLPEDEIFRLNAESARAKILFRQEKNKYSQKIESIKSEIAAEQHKIAEKKDERRRRSVRLQQYLFEQFVMQNAKGERKNLVEIFAGEGRVPPAGAGECAAPKLLQFAYENRLKPLAVAEFWYGKTSAVEMRRHGEFYPACHAKCEPILNFMLQGLQVEENPLKKCAAVAPKVLSEDEFLLVVDKPPGMLSAAGRDGNAPSVEQWAQARCASARVAHRLDMATSGILLVAKTEDAYKRLQAQFAAREVEKRYVAVLAGMPLEKEGRIALPLCPNIENRPLQKVDFLFGKESVTDYKTISYEENFTRVHFFPHTGRTHQLRVHAAHPDGLNAPIRGDELYGKKDGRLFLHAEWIRFRHPQTGEWLEFASPADF